MGAVVLDMVRVFWIRCGCSGEGQGVLGEGVCLLDKNRLFWSEKGCCGVSAGVLDKVLVF